MHVKAQKLFYSLAIFVLLNALFVLTNANDAKSNANNANLFVDSHNSFVVSHYDPVMAFKLEVRERLRIGFWQTVGDQPWFEDLEIAVRGIDNFYKEATDAMLALLAPTPHEDGMNQVIAGVWNTFDKSDRSDKSDRDDRGRIAGLSAEARAEAELLIEGKFMQEEPLRNIIPGKHELGIVDYNIEGIVAGELYKTEEPINGFNEWVTVQDNYTGQLYCLAIYNNEVNKYLGPCKLEGDLQ